MKYKFNPIILCLFAGFALFLFLPRPASAALIAHWKFDEGTGSAPADSGGNNITGTFTVGTPPTWSTDVPPVSFTDPYSLDFSRTGDAVYFNWPSGLNFTGTANRSFSFWYKPTANGENASGNYDRIMSWSGDKFEIAGTLGDVAVHRLAFYDGNWRDTGYDLTPGTWYHITFTYDGTNVKLYVNDTVKFSGTSAGRDVNGTMYIGLRYTGDEGINGRIDDFRIYDTALTPTQISNLTAGSSNPDVAPDTTPPVISSVAATGASTSGAVTWTTDEASSTKVLYSADTSYSSSTTEIDTGTRVTSHSQTVSGLLSCMLYNYKVVSVDAANNSTTSSAGSFTTTGCAGSATPTSNTTNTVTVSSTSTTSNADAGRTLGVNTPANFTNAASSVIIQIKGLPADTVLNSIGRPSSTLSSAAAKVFDVRALINNTTELTSFDSPVSVSYTFTNSDISGLDRSTIVMYHYASGSWSQLSSCSTSGNTVTCNASHFSVFALFAQTASSSGGGVGLPAEAYDRPRSRDGTSLVMMVVGGRSQKSPDVQLIFNSGSNVSQISLSNSPDFSEATIWPYSAPVHWNLCWRSMLIFAPSTCSGGLHTVYAKLYTRWGQSSEVLSTSVALGKVGAESLYLYADAGTVYIVARGVRYAFASERTFFGLGYRYALLKKVRPATDIQNGPVLSSPRIPHVPGSWVRAGKAVYYVSAQGLILVPSQDILVQNGGRLEYVVPANSYDTVLPKLGNMVQNDARVSW